MKAVIIFNLVVRLMVVVFFALCNPALAVDGDGFIEHLVSWWKFDEGSGTTAYDSAGDNNGTLIGDTNWVPGRIGSYALDFDGSGDYVGCGDIDEIDGATNITISAWINTNNIANQKLISRKGESTTPYYFWVMSDYTVNFGIYVASDNYSARTTEAILPNQWFFVTGTYDGETVRTYINGVEKAVNAEPSGAIYSNAHSVTIGAGYTDYPTAWFDGTIDDVRIYDKALPAEEIRQLYHESNKALNLNPEDEAMDVPVDVVLSWIPGYSVQDVNGHEVYFGTSWSDVNEANGISHPNVELYIVSDPCCDVGTLSFATTYFWRVDEVNEPDVWKGNVWSFTTDNGKAIDPDPGDGAICISPGLEKLYWTPSPYAVSQNVHFGTNFEDVNTETIPDYSGLTGDVGECNIPEGYLPLLLYTNYYWRVDAYNGVLPVTKGDVWTFKTRWMEDYIYVDDEGLADFNNIQAAIDEACNGVTVIVAPGTYTGNGNRDIDYKGKAITVRSVDPNDPNIVAATIIDCQGTKSEPRRGFYFHNGEGPNSVLSGLTITNGWADEGGGICCVSSSPIISRCIMIKNSIVCHGAGGGVYCKTSNPIISNCIIKSNSAPYGSGGGICCMEGSNPIIINCSITGNLSEGGGGGILCESHSSPTLTNCTIVGNTASYCCGGICCLDDSNVTITNSILWGNSPPAIVAKGSLITYSNVEGGRDGEGNIDEDPCFASDTDYHLICGSPCIDAANNTPDVNLPETDIEGRPRIIDGDNDTNPVIDMGAYEYNPNENAIVVSSRSLSFIQNWPGPDPITLLIGNRGSAELQWEIIIIEDCNWLQLSLMSGSSTGQITLTADTNGLEPGNYSCTLQVVAPNAINSPVDVNVTLPVGQLLRVPHDFNTIQQAIDASADNDIVLVADGIYTGDGNKNLDYKGKAITVRSENGPENCIIDCEGFGIGFSFHSAERENSIVQGFTITDGNDPSNPRRGGIIYCKRASPTISNCHIISNMGEGIEAEYSDVIITNCTICNNMSGITSDGNLRIFDCNISGNGSGIKVSGQRGTTIIVTDCTINENADTGIEISYRNNSAIIRNCVISNNAGTGIFYRVEWYGGLLKISDSTVCYNADGGISIRGDRWNRATISRCIITGNTTNFAGGGIDCDKSEALTVANCTIVGNYALYPGGGICARSNENLSVVNCTIADNHSDFGGGGIFHDAWVSVPNALSGTITNTILWGNTAGSVGPQIAFDSLPPPSLILAVSYCDIQDGQMGVYVGEGCTLDWSLGNIDANPCFVQPGYWDPNGTSDDANDDFWVDGDYHLKSEGWRWDEIRQRWDYDDVTSRCIDAGNPGCPLGDEPLTVPEDPDNIWGQNLRINMGAYGGTDEASMPPYGWALLADLTNDGIVNFLDFAGQVQDWLMAEEEQPGDLNRDTLVDIADIALLAEDWLK